MSVAGQFKRVGQRSAAYGLWGLIIWLFTKPWLSLFAILALLLAIIGISVSLDDSGKTFYVNINSLELLDKPFGKKVRTLHLNDSVVLIKKMSDDWMQVALDKDTLYFKENFFHDGDLGYTYKIDKTPLTKWKAIEGRKVTLNHPNGYLETGSSMLKNGDVIEVISYSEVDRKIRFKNKGGTFSEVSIDYVKINWDAIFRKYPRLKESK